jgi:hypothetical protein
MLISRNLEYCAYGSSGISLVDDLDEAERKYNSVSLKERAKVGGEEGRAGELQGRGAAGGQGVLCAWQVHGRE